MNSNIVLQIERQSAGNLPFNSPVIFDSVVNSNGDISYASDTGTVSFYQTGRYLVEWWVAIEANISTHDVAFSIEGTNITPSMPIVGNSPVRTGSLVGFAIVDITDVPAQMRLVNTGDRQEVWLSQNVPVQAALRIQSHHELNYLDDGNAEGSLAGSGAKTGYPMGNYATALGFQTTASGEFSHAQGYESEALAQASHAEGYGTVASSNYAHAEGFFTTASGMVAHAEGSNTQALTDYSHAEGFYSEASGVGAHSEGSKAKATADYSHAEGFETVASNIAAHAEGEGTQALGEHSHAEGFYTQASGAGSHAEGDGTQATGDYAHAMGFYTQASGMNSHAEGNNTSTALYEGSHIMGRFGDAQMNYSWFLANGTDLDNKGLAAKIQTDGNAYIDGVWNSGGADYAEMFETLDGNPIEPGYFVTVGNEEKIRVANGETDRYILGISSSFPSVLGNAGEMRWKDKYLTDEWGRIQYHEVSVPAVTNPDGKTVMPDRLETQPILNPQWNPKTEYVPRRNRPEWVSVGLLGQVRVRDDGTCFSGGYCQPNIHGIATAAETGYRVLKRTGERQVLVLFR